MLAVVAIFGCWAAGHLDGAFGSKNVVILCLILLLIATIGDISTTRDFTLFGLIPLDPGDTAGLFSTQGERIYILFGLLIGLAFGPVPGILALLHVAQRRRGGGGPLFRPLCAVGPRDHLHGHRPQQPE